MVGKKNRAVYQLKVTLRDIHPPIWGRIQLWEDATLAQLHRTLQIVMSWEDYHLHAFAIGRRVYSVPDPNDQLYERKVLDERRVRLREVVTRVGTEFEYLYDFGDSWRHDLVFEAIVLPEQEASYPCCLAANTAHRPKASADRLATKITSKAWPTPGTKSTRMCLNGGVPLTPRRFRSWS